MRQVLARLKSKFAKNKEQISKLEARISATEPGILEVKLIHGKKRFVRRKQGTSNFEYLGEDKIGRIKALAQKRYEVEFLKQLKNQTVVIDKCIKIIEKVDTATKLSNVYTELPSEIKELVVPNVVTTAGYVQRWQAYENPGLEIPIDTSFFSVRGDHVRSKSELIIADRLYHAKVPYHYEFPVRIGGARYNPDFTVLNPKTLKEYIWEHFGKIDDEEYATKAKNKLEMYAKGGYFPGKNLIMTFETSTNPLNTQYVDLLIKQYLA